MCENKFCVESITKVPKKCGPQAPGQQICAYVMRTCLSMTCGPCRPAQTPHRILPICCVYIRGQKCGGATCKPAPGPASLIDMAILTKNGFDHNRPLHQWHEVCLIIKLCRNCPHNMWSKILESLIVNSYNARAVHTTVG